MNNKKLKASIAALSFCISAWMMPGNVAFAANNILMNTSQSQDISMPGGISRIAIANPEIADVTVMSGDDVLIVAKKTGSTTLFVWDRGGTRNEYTVVVTQQDVATGEAIQHIIGYPGVTVDKIGDQILLGGRVLDQGLPAHQRNHRLIEESVLWQRVVSQSPVHIPALLHHMLARLREILGEHLPDVAPLP